MKRRLRFLYLRAKRTTEIHARKAKVYAVSFRAVEILIAVALIVLVACWFSYFGTHWLIRDSTTLIICAIWGYIAKEFLTQYLSHLSRSLSRLPAIGLLCWIFPTLVLTWVATSTLDHIFIRNHYPITTSTRSDHSDRDPGLALCLSGGGYRAALLHAGVLHQLERMDQTVKSISAVSGGAIIGAYYTIGGSPHSFLDIVKSGGLSLGREIIHIDAILCAYAPPAFSSRLCKPEPGLYGTTLVQARLLDRILLENHNLATVNDAQYPNLVLGTTDLVTGNMVGITPRGSVRIKILQPSVVLHRTSAQFNPPKPRFFSRTFDRIPETTNLSTLVAASGALPGFFQPVALEPNLTARSLVLADGGITDNLGLSLLIALHHVDPEPSTYHEFLEVPGAAPQTSRPFLDRASLSKKSSPAFDQLPWLSPVVIVVDGGFAFLGAHASESSLFDSLTRTISIMQANAGSGRLVKRVVDLQSNLDNQIRVIVLSPRLLLPEVPRYDLLSSGVSRETIAWSYSPETGEQSTYTRYLDLDPQEREALNDILPDETRRRHLKHLDHLGHEARDEATFEAIRDDVVLGLDSFLGMSTVQDRPSARDADAVFRLGRYLYILGLAPHSDRIGRLGPLLQERQSIDHYQPEDEANHER